MLGVGAGRRAEGTRSNQCLSEEVGPTWQRLKRGLEEPLVKPESRSQYRRPMAMQCVVGATAGCSVRGRTGSDTCSYKATSLKGQEQEQEWRRPRVREVLKELQGRPTVSHRPHGDEQAWVPGKPRAEEAGD